MEQHVERAVDTTFGSAEKVKVQTADALEEAALKLREMSMTAKGEDIKSVLNETGDKIDQLKAEMGEKVQPVQDFVTEHPFMSIAIAVGAGLLIGALVVRRD